MQNLQNTLIELLKDDANYTSEGKLLKNKLTEDALKLESSLLKYLLKNDRLKKHFFIDVDGTLVFDKDKFIQFVNDKEFLPDSYTSFRNKIGLLDEDGKYFSEKRDVVLAWPYKDCVLEGGQDKEDQKRNEIFYNEVLAPDEIDRLFDPKVLTNFQRYDKDGEHKNPDDLSRNDNLIIKGNNLLALHSLKKLYREKVKLIYIDPPFNTGDDEFKYNDKFKHSTWLSFIKNRLETSKELLNNEGVIFIHIDYRELGYLKTLGDQIFGNENFVGQINWQRVPEGRTLLGQGESDITISTEYLLIFAKKKKQGLLNNLKKRTEATEKVTSQYSSILTINSEPIELEQFEDSQGKPVTLFKFEDFEIRQLDNNNFDDYKENYENMVQSVGVQEESSFAQLIISKLEKIDTLCMAEYIPSRGKRKGTVVKDLFLNGRKLLYAKDYSILEDEKIFRYTDMNDFWSNSEIQVTDIANEGGVVLRRGKKPEALLHRVIEWGTNSENDLVMDFFLGSGTTAAVAHKMGRKYIGIEQLDYGDNDSVVRLKNVINGDQSGISKSVDWQGGGSFIYAELKKWNQNYIDDIEDAKTKKKLLTIYKKMKDEAFFRYDVDLSKFEENEFSELELDQQKEVLIECLDKNHLYVNLSEMDDTTYAISDEDKAMNKKFYGLD